MYRTKKIIEWLYGDDTGISSKAIVYVMMGLSPKKFLKRNWGPYPHDADDFGRCYRLLLIFPDWKKRINEMSCLGKIWKRIAAHWEELEGLYEKNKHKELYKRLQELQPDEDEENCNKITIGNGISVMTRK